MEIAQQIRKQAEEKNKLAKQLFEWQQESPTPPTSQESIYEREKGNAYFKKKWRWFH